MTTEPDAVSSEGAPAPPVASTPVPVTADTGRTHGVTRRVVVLSLALAVCFGYLIPVIDMKTRNTFLGAAHLPPGAIAVLLILLLVINPLLCLLSRRLSFARNEVLTVYITRLFSCLVPGHGAENFFVTSIIGPYYRYCDNDLESECQKPLSLLGIPGLHSRTLSQGLYYATRENKWLEFLQPYLSPWLTPALSADGTYGDRGRAVIEGWFTGLRPDEAILWGPGWCRCCCGAFSFKAP